MMSSILLQKIDEINPNIINSLLYGFLEKAITLGERIIIAVVIYFVGKWIISLIQKLINRILVRRNVEETVSSFIKNLTNTALKIFLFVTIIGTIGIETTSLAAILAALGLAIGMAMKDNLSNFAGGVMILLNKPFKLNDYIIAQGQEGTVKDIGILYTVLITSDGRTIFMPNGPLSTGSITNNSTQNTRRVDITFSVNYGNNTDELRKILIDVINSNTLISKSPEPFIGITSVNKENIDVTIRVWTTTSNYGNLSTQLNESIYKSMTDNGIFKESTLNIRMTKDQ